MSCECCKFFDEHPFIREGDYMDYCRLSEKPTSPSNNCENFVEDK